MENLVQGILYIFCVILIIQISACDIKQTETISKRLPAFAADDFQQGSTLKILPEESEIRILVYRGGALASLGHNHVISTNKISGKIYRHQLIKHSGVQLEFPVNALQIDDRQQRLEAGEGFSSVPSEKDIAGTRNNMLGEDLLFAEQFPHIKVASVLLSQSNEQISALMRIQIKDYTCDIEAPINLSEENRQIIVSGEIEFSQRHCGLTPFSILMGTIAVKDKLNIQYRFTSEPLP